MATITGAAGGGNWSAGGSWVGGVAPTASDDVLLTATSGNITIDSNSNVCNSLNCTGYTGTLTHNSGITLSIGSSVAGLTNIALTLVSGMTYTLGNASSSAISFVSTSATVQTITLGGKVLGSVIFNGAGGNWQLAAAFSCGTGTITLTAGTLDANGQTVTCKNFTSSNSNTRALTMGASTWNISGNGDPWDFTTSTGLTFTCGTSTINASYSNGTFRGGGKTFYSLVITQNNAGPTSIAGANTFTILNVNGVNNSDIVSISDNITVTGTFTASGSSSTNMPSIRGVTPGIAVTITAAAVSLSNVFFMDIVGAGAATWSGTLLGDVGGNSGITFTTPSTLYWVATVGGNFGSTSSWSTSSGGASGARVPLPQDTAVFDANSITSAARTITVNVQCIPTLDFTNILNTPTVTFTLNFQNIYLYGNLKIIAGMTWSGTSGIFLVGRGSQTIDTNSVSSTPHLFFQAPGGTYSLSSSLVTSTAMDFVLGALNANGFNVTCASFTTNYNGNVRTLTLGSGTWTMTGTGTVWNAFGNSGLTLNCNASTIAITNTSSTQKTFSGGSLTYNILSITSGGTGVINIVDINTFSQISCTGGAATLTFQSGVAQTITNAFNVSGTSGNLVTINSNSSGTAASLSFTGGGLINCDYLSIKDSAPVQTNVWFAGNHSSKVSNTGNWAFGVGYTSPQTASLSQSGSMFRRAAAPFTATISLSGVFLPQNIYVILAAALSFSGSIKRNITKSLPAASVTEIGAFVRASQLPFGATVSESGAIGRRSTNVLSAALSHAGVISRQISHFMVASLPSAGLMVKKIIKSLTAASISFAGIQGKQKNLSLSGNIGLLGGGNNRFNLITNPSFEVDISGWDNALSVSTLSQTAAQSFIGSGSMQLVSSGAGNSAARSTCTLPSAGGKPFMFSVYLRAGTTSVPIQVYLNWFTSAGGFLGNSPVTSGIATNAGWTRFSANGIAPSNAGLVQAFVIFQTSGVETHYMDAAMIESSSILGDYFDGSVVPAEWIGAPNASVSFMGLVGKRVTKGFGQTLGYSGTFGRLPIKNLAAILSYTAAITRFIRRQLTTSMLWITNYTFGSGTFGNSGDSFGIGTTDALLKRTNKPFTSSVSSTGIYGRRPNKSLLANLTYAGSLNRFITRAFSSVVNLNGSVLKQVGRPFTGSVSFAGQLTRRVGKTLLANVSTAASMGRQVNRLFFATLGYSGAFTKLPKRALQAGISFVAQIRRVTKRNLTSLVLFRIRMIGNRRTTVGRGEAKIIDPDAFNKDINIGL